MILVRQEIGEVLRDFRQQKGRTLRQVASRASVALGYLSEVERGQKEASSEILASVAEALDVPISIIMREVGDRISVLEGLQGFPDVVPDDLVASVDAELLAALTRLDGVGRSSDRPSHVRSDDAASEFDRAVDDEFGAGAASADHRSGAVGSRRPHRREALAAGIPPREVWLALCARPMFRPSAATASGASSPAADG